jgi:hypothetical protein
MLDQVEIGTLKNEPYRYQSIQDDAKKTKTHTHTHIHIQMATTFENTTNDLQCLDKLYTDWSDIII